MISAVEKFLRTPEVENLPKKQQNAKKILLKSTLDFELEKHKITYFHISVCVLCLVCRMDMIQCALDSPHLVECFRYPH